MAEEILNIQTEMNLSLIVCQDYSFVWETGDGEYDGMWAVLYNHTRPTLYSGPKQFSIICIIQCLN